MAVVVAHNASDAFSALHELINNETMTRVAVVSTAYALNEATGSVREMSTAMNRSLEQLRDVMRRRAAEFDCSRKTEWRPWFECYAERAISIVLSLIVIVFALPFFVLFPAMIRTGRRTTDQHDSVFDLTHICIAMMLMRLVCPRDAARDTG